MAGSRNFQLLLAAALGALAAGCGQSPDPTAEARGDGVPAAAAAAHGKARVVVAVIDSGINPYHEYFNASEGESQSPIYPPGSPPSAVTPEVLKEFGIDQNHVIKLHRTRHPDADVASDHAAWARVKPDQPYWFEGTNIIAVGRHGPDLGGSPDPGPLILPNGDSDSHGVDVVASLLKANPDAIVFFVQQNNDTQSADAGSQEAHEIAFLHPAVDIVSTSYVRYAQPEVKAFYSTFDAVVRLGKLHVAAAIDPGAEPTVTTAGSGPWWSIGVSGFDEGYSNGRTFSGSLPDFVALDYQAVPACATCQTGGKSNTGTSLAAPYAAGVISRVLLEARRTFGHGGGIRSVDGVPVMVQTPAGGITNWQIRRAMEQAAYVPTSAEYNPTGGAKSPPIQDEAPWVQVAWGVLSPDPDRHVVEEALGFLGLGSTTRVKAPGFCDFQTKVIQERHAYWDNVSPVADQVIPDYVAGNDLDTGGDAAQPLDSDPFIYCGSTLPPL